jgi:anti-anti-sigma regulatory factor
MSVAPSGATAIVKVSGNVEAGDSVSLFAVFEEVVVGEYSGAFVDLSGCRDLDSTFIGMLLVMYEKYSGSKGDFCLVNVGTQNTRALQMLGVSTMIPMRDLRLSPPPEFVPIDLTAYTCDSKEKIEIMELAHKALVAADRQNAQKFGSFLRLLDEEKSG